MRRTIAGFGRPVGRLSFAAALLTVAGAIACFGKESTTDPLDHRRPPTLPPTQQPPGQQPPAQQPPEQQPPAATPTSPFVVDTGATPGGWLAIEQQVAGKGVSIYLVRPDGSGGVQLTHGTDDWGAAWSPDGAWIAFTRNSSEMGIWIIRPDGSGEKLLTGQGSFPFWLDDGRVAYECEDGVCAIGVDGANPVTLFKSAAPTGTFDTEYALSPDGKQIAFVRFIDDAAARHPIPVIYVANRDGSAARRLTTSADDASESYPRWSRDGRQILYWSAYYGIAVADVDGGLVHRVLPRALNGSQSVVQVGSVPDWSPDGTKVVFGLTANEFYLVNADGTGLIRRVRSTLPSFSGNGEWWGGTWSWSPR